MSDRPVSESNPVRPGNRREMSCEPTRKAETSFNSAYPPMSESSQVSVRIRGRNNQIKVLSGDVQRTMSEQRASRKALKQRKQIEKRLRTLERIEVFRKQKQRKQLEEAHEQKILYLQRLNEKKSESQKK